MSDTQADPIKKQLYALGILIIISAAALGIRFFTAPRFKTASSGTREVMGTFVNIVSVAPDSKTANASIEAAFLELVRIDEMMSDYKPASPLSQINKNAFKEPVAASREIMEVLSIAKKYSKLSGGAFDITIGPVVDLWRNSQKQGVKPTDEELAKAKAKVGYKKLILNESDNTVRFAVEGMRLDLGAVAKGYAIDSAVRVMKNSGAVAGFVDVGGDVLTFGVPPKPKKHWLIGLQDPTKENSLLLVLKINDMAIATSGDYQRYEEIDGKKYSHIKDPKTSQAAKALRSVTVIAPTAVVADILATMVSVMGPEKGLAMIEKMENTELIMIPADEKQTLIHTKNAPKYVDNTQPPVGYTTVSQMLKL
jgi:FAD:protein FMN transferase